MKDNKAFIIRQAKVSDAEDIYYINKTSLGYDYDLNKQRNNMKKTLLKRFTVTKAVFHRLQII